MPALDGGPAEPLHVGVDLGTAYLVLAVLDRDMQPLAGEYQFAEVVRDGLVVDYLGAIDLLKEMKARVEKRLGVQLTHAASGFPPGVHQVEVRAMANVVDAVGLRCDTMVDEPTAANALLRLQNGAIVDVGGGTTGIAILQDGEVVYTADEPTGDRRGTGYLFRGGRGDEGGSGRTGSFVHRRAPGDGESGQYRRRSRG